MLVVEVGVVDVAALERRVGEVVVEVGDKNFVALVASLVVDLGLELA